MSQTTSLIKRLRVQHKMSQTEISRLTGVPQPRLSRWENGGAPDTADDALKLAALVEQMDRTAKRKEARSQRCNAA